MKVISQLLLLLAIVPFLALAKNPDARFLKKPKAPKSPKAPKAPAPKAPKTPKAPAPASKKSPKASQSPSAAPTAFGMTQILYSTSATELETSLSFIDSGDPNDQEGSRFARVDLGVVKAHSSATETVGLVHTSFTVSIGGESALVGGPSDGFTLDGKVLLSILAYAGCDSAAACEAAGVTPTPLIPEEVEMLGWYKDEDGVARNRALAPGPTSCTNGIDVRNRALEPGPTSCDELTSTNEATFLLVGKGGGNFFLQANILLRSELVTYYQGGTGVTVDDWIIIIEDTNKHFTVSDFTLSPTVSPTAVPSPVPSQFPTGKKRRE